jgi:hypothetical protein
MYITSLDTPLNTCARYASFGVIFGMLKEV